MAFLGARRGKNDVTFEAEYAQMVKTYSGGDAYLKLLEKDNRFGDIVFRFSAEGKPYNLHRIVLCAALDIEISDQNILETMTKAPLNETLENFVLRLIYGAKLPTKYPLGLVDTLKVFVRSFRAWIFRGK